MTTAKTSREQVSAIGLSPLDDRLAALRELMPEAATEGGIDWDKLRATLGEKPGDLPDRYRFEWAGKRDAIRLLQTPCAATLVPAREDSVDFDDTQHIFIEGENLEVLKLLYKSYADRVKLIYIDPPYNRAGDFIYCDDYRQSAAVYYAQTGQADGRVSDRRGEAEQANRTGRLHSAWLSMMYPRLFLARQLLRDDGVVFVSIDDTELHHLRLLMNEVFGEENFIATIAVQLNPRGRHLDPYIARTHEYVVVYSRSPEGAALRGLPKDERMAGQYDKEDQRGRYRELELRNRNPAFNRRTRPGLYYPLYVCSASGTVSLERDRTHTEEVWPRNSSGGESCWTWSPEKTERDAGLLVARRAATGGWRVFRKDYLLREDGERATTKPKALWTEKEINNDHGKKAVQALFGFTAFDFPKSPELIRRILRIGSEPGDLIVDFFAGSCTTAQAVFEENIRAAPGRRCLLVQMPEPLPADSELRDRGYATIAEIGLERVRRCGESLTRNRGEASRPGTRAHRGDVGVRVFRLADSHYRPWAAPDAEGADAATYVEHMRSFEDPLRDGWEDDRGMGITGAGVIYEVAIKEAGYGLNCRIEKVGACTKNTVYRVIDPDRGRHFHICLDPKLDPATPRVLNLSGDADLFVCRDIALDDTLAANLGLQCRLKTI